MRLLGFVAGPWGVQRRRPVAAPERGVGQRLVVQHGEALVLGVARGDRHAVLRGVVCATIYVRGEDLPRALLSASCTALDETDGVVDGRRQGRDCGRRGRRRRGRPPRRGRCGRSGPWVTVRKLMGQLKRRDVRQTAIFVAVATVSESGYSKRQTPCPQEGRSENRQ